MDQIEKDVIAAEKLHLSYGYYKALSYNPSREAPTIPRKKDRSKPTPQPNPRKYTDQEAFALWQAGMSDSEIGKVFGASRASVQRWRDQLELPVTSKTQIDTKKYRLSQMEDGTSIVVYTEQSAGNL